MLGKVGSLVGSFSGVAAKFLGPVQSLLSKAGLGTIAGFLGGSQNTSQLLSMARDLFTARKSQPATDPTTDAIVKENLLKMFAQRQAQLLSAA